MSEGPTEAGVRLGHEYKLFRIGFVVGLGYGGLSETPEMHGGMGGEAYDRILPALVAAWEHHLRVEGPKTASPAREAQEGGPKA